MKEDKKITKIMDRVLDKEERNTRLYAEARKIVRERIGFWRYWAAWAGDRIVTELIFQVKEELENVRKQSPPEKKGVPI